MMVNKKNLKLNVSNEVTVTTTSVGPYNDTYTTDDVTLFKFRKKSPVN